MRLRKMHWIGIVFSALILIADVIFFRNDSLFVFLIGISVAVIALPFIVGIMIEGRSEKEKNEMFLEFTRNLAENVKGGTPMGQSIRNMKEKNFGSLTPHIVKLANQISVGIPMSTAFQTFGDDIGSVTVRRAISLIQEAESAGGKIDDILDSVASSIYQTEKLKKERKAAVSNLIVQGYIVFFIFIGIMLVMQFKILPLTTDIDISAGAGAPGPLGGITSGEIPSAEQLARPFLVLLIIQGIFSGLAIGKLAEGSIKSGVKHSFVMSVTAFLMATGASVFL